MPKRHITVAALDHRPLELSDLLRSRFEQIRAEQDVPAEFPADVIAEAEAVAGLDGRDLPTRDETAVPFITIDPPGSMDLDQALHIEPERTADGSGFRVRYAITDLPVFLTPGGAMDQEARRRGQTIYSPDLRTPLHPPVLSESVASLLPGQVCPAYVWDMHLAADGAVTDATVYRAMVRSRGRTDYENVQRQVNDGTAEGTIAQLALVGPLRVARELERGGASLPMPEQEVLKAEDGSYAVRFRPPLPSEEWSAQISLMTGMVAADLMLRHRVGILRTMPPPPEASIARFRRSAAAIGVRWRKGTRYGAFLRTLDRTDPKHLALIFEATTLFRGSGYTVLDGSVPEQTLHAAVAAPYAHVTAPLRRLVDRFALVVCAALEEGRPVPDWVVEALPSLPSIMAQTSARSNSIERASADAVEAAVLRGRVGETFEVAVVDRLRGKTPEVIVKLAEPAVITRASGSGRLGSLVPAELTTADVATSTVRFAVAPGPGSRPVRVGDGDAP